jgi:hypothetical protein
MPHYIIIATIWMASCLIIAACGTKFRFGFWGYFFGSLILSPVIGLLLLLAAIPPRQRAAPREKVSSRL